MNGNPSRGCAANDSGSFGSPDRLRNDTGYPHLESAVNSSLKDCQDSLETVLPFSVTGSQSIQYAAGAAPTNLIRSGCWGTLLITVLHISRVVSRLHSSFRNVFQSSC